MEGSELLFKAQLAEAQLELALQREATAVHDAAAAVAAEEADSATVDEKVG